MTSVSSKVPITITGNNIVVTEALVDYINKKLDRPFGKLRSNGAIKDCDVHLSVNKNPKVRDGHRIDVTTTIKGTTFHSSEESDDMYASIDAVSDRLSRKLRAYKERRLDGHHGGKTIGDEMFDELSAIDDIEEEEQALDEAINPVDPFAPEIVAVKSFNLNKPITMQEAIFALDYVDHDFYVYRDADTDQISVVYKRNVGGIGLIQPEQ